MSQNIPDDLVKYDEAARELDVTVPQIRKLILKGRVTKYKRGALRGVWVSRAEVTWATAITPKTGPSTTPESDK
ncbi:MAG: hypothetical protein ABI068_08465 [Ktedonobacterales bacterium]